MKTAHSLSRLLMMVTHGSAVVIGLALLSGIVLRVIGRATVDCSAWLLCDDSDYGACGSDPVTWAIVVMLLLLQLTAVVSPAVGLIVWLRQSTRLPLLDADVGFLLFAWPLLWFLSPDWFPVRLPLSSIWVWYLSAATLLGSILAEWLVARSRTALHLAGRSQGAS